MSGLALFLEAKRTAPCSLAERQTGVDSMGFLCEDENNYGDQETHLRLSALTRRQ